MLPRAGISTACDLDLPANGSVVWFHADLIICFVQGVISDAHYSTANLEQPATAAADAFDVAAWRFPSIAAAAAWERRFQRTSEAARSLVNTIADGSYAHAPSAPKCGRNAIVPSTPRPSTGATFWIRASGSAGVSEQAGWHFEQACRHPKPEHVEERVSATEITTNATPFRNSR